MKIVTFYSYKGGVGRSLSLLNVAYYLSQQRGQRIGLIDLDIEASGLSHITKCEVQENRHLLALLPPVNNNGDLSELEEFIHEVPFDEGQQSRVFLLPTLADPDLLNRVKWNKALEHFIAEIFKSFGRLYHLDYLFIDSRSGLSQFSDFTLREADLDVLVCRLDIQNRYGMRLSLETCRAFGKPFKIVVSACPEGGRDEHLASFEKEVGVKVDHVLPYYSRLYFEEIIVSKEEPGSDLAAAYTTLSTDIHQNS
jgi:MinD-like ATPase involved in chromosome partitioning or flagellar assembly